MTHNKQTRNKLRGTCPVCNVHFCMYDTGDGEFVCEERKKNCGAVYPQSIVARNKTGYFGEAYETTK